MEQRNDKMAFCVEVVGVSGDKKRVDLCDTEEQFKTVTVEELKEKIIHLLSSRSRDWPKYIELIFENKTLGDSTLLHENGITHESIIYMACVYGKKSVMKKDDEESVAQTSAGEEERRKQEDKETIQVLICVSWTKKFMAVFCNTVEEMQKMTVELLIKKIKKNVKIGKYNVRDCELYFNGKCLEENSSLLSDHGVQHMSTVEVTILRCFYSEVQSFNLTEHKKSDEKRLSIQYFGDFEKLLVD